MKAAIFAVGTELLFGQTVNTNAVYLSKELNIMGFDVLYHFTVGDNYERLRESVEYALKDCNILITTGGLGPTQDDLTKELLADMFDDQLVLHQPSLEHIKKLFDRMHFEMTENNIKQAYMPQNGIVLKNDQGTAPGCIFMNRGKYAICLPGPYREMISMFEKLDKSLQSISTLSTSSLSSHFQNFDFFYLLKALCHALWNLSILRGHSHTTTDTYLIILIKSLRAFSESTIR